jgi:hypothetical protein
MEDEACTDPHCLECALQVTFRLLESKGFTENECIEAIMNTVGEVLGFETQVISAADTGVMH